METTIEKVIHLQRIDMFADIPTEQLAYLAGIAQDTRFKKGEILYSEGDSSDCMYVLIDGAIEIERKGREKKNVDHDEAFGIWGFFDRQPRLYTAQATEDSYLFKIDHADFYDLIENRVHLSRGLIKFLVKNIRQFIEETDQAI